MKSQAETIAELNARCDGPSQFQKFDRPFHASPTVPEVEILKEEGRQQRDRAKKRAKKKC